MSHAVRHDGAEGRGFWLDAVLLFGAALLVRIVYLVQSRANPLHDHVYALADSRYYHAEALRLAQGEWLSATPYFLGPLYPHVIAPLYAWATPGPAGVRALQCVLGALSCVLLYDCGRRIFSRGTGLLAGALLAFYGLHVYYTETLLPTVLVLFLNLLFLRVMLPGRTGFGTARCLAGGGLAGLAALAKSNALLLVPFAAAVVWWTGRGEPRRQRIAGCGALALGAALAILPATAHNYAVSGRFVLVNTTTGRNLWKGNGPLANGTHVFLPPGGLSFGKYIGGRVDPERPIRDSNELTARTLSHVLEYPGATTALLGKKLVLFFNAVELGVRDQFYFAKQYSSLLRLPLPGFGLIAPLGLLGMATALRRGRARSVAMLYALMAVQVASFVAVFVLARYRIVAVACLTLFAAHQLREFAEAIRSRHWGRLAAGGLTIAILALLVNRPLPEFPKDRGFSLQHKRLGNVRFDAGDHAGAIAAYRRSLGGDWLDKDRLREETDVRVRIAVAQAHLGDAAAARDTARRVRADLARVDPRWADWKRAAEQSLSEMERLLATREPATERSP